MKRGQRLTDEVRAEAARQLDDRIAKKQRRERELFPAAFAEPVVESEADKLKKHFQSIIENACRSALPRETRDYIDGVEDGARVVSEALMAAIDEAFADEKKAAVA